MESPANKRVCRNQRPLAVCCAAGLTVCCPAPFAAPLTCADMQARIEAQYKAKGAAPPPLKIVPKGLVAGMQVLGSCENGSQRIAYRPAEAATPASGSAQGKPGAAFKPARP